MSLTKAIHKAASALALGLVLHVSALAACPTPLTWSASDKGADNAVSNGQLTVTRGSGSTNTCQNIRATQALGSGKYYWTTYVIAAASGGQNAITGIANSSINVTTNCIGYEGGNNNSIGYYNNGIVARAATTVTTIQTSANFSVVDTAVDTVNKLIWFRTNTGNWNNSGTASPATGVGGISFSAMNAGPYYPIYGTYVTGDQANMMFNGDTRIPVGFSPPGGSFYGLSVADRSGNGAGMLGSGPFSPQLGNMGWTASGYAGDAATRSNYTFPTTTGKYYFEFYTTTVSTNRPAWGIGNSSANLSSYVGSDNNSIGNAPAGGCTLNNVSCGTMPAFTSGQYVDVAVDLSAKLIWFRTNGGSWNGGGTANPATGVGGSSFSTMNAGPYFVFFDAYNTAAGYVDFGRQPFAYAAPAGFSAVDSCLAASGGLFFMGPL